MFVKGAGAWQFQLDHTMVLKDKDHTLGNGYRPLLALLSGSRRPAARQITRFFAGDILQFSRYSPSSNRTWAGETSRH